MTAIDARPAGSNFVKTAIQVTPGGSGAIDTLVTTTNNVPLTGDKLKTTFDMVNEKIMLASRFSNAIKDPSRCKGAGQLNYLLNPALGLDFMVALLGATTTTSAISAVATSAPSTTANGVETITVAGVWTPGAHVLLDVSVAGAEQSTTIHTVVEKGSVSGTLKVPSLPARLASGKYVTQPAQMKIANTLLPGANKYELPMLTVEQGRGGQYSLVYGACLVDKMSLSFGKGAIQTSVDLLSAYGFPELAQPSGTTITMGTFNPSPQDLLDAERPWNDAQSMMVFVSDPDATGTSMLQAQDITGLKLDYDNKCIEDPVMTQKNRYLYTPGDEVSCKFSFMVRNTSKRNAQLLDLVRYSASTPLHIFSSRNNGTAALPVHRGMSIYSPFAKLDTAEDDTAIGKTNAISVTGEAMPGPGEVQDLIQMFIL